jgi:hypothetical protein
VGQNEKNDFPEGPKHFSVAKITFWKKGPIFRWWGTK